MSEEGKYLSISYSQVIGKVEHYALELLEQSLVPFLDHEISYLIQEANDVIIEFLGWFIVFLILFDQAYKAL